MSADIEVRFAVVDDMEQDRVLIAEESSSILTHAKVLHSIDCYSDAKALLDAMRSVRKTSSARVAARGGKLPSVLSVRAAYL